MSVDCPHWSDCGVKGGGCCALKRFGGKPSIGMCGVCAERSGVTLESRGIGDVVKKITSAVGMKPCGGCAKRRDKLNRIFPLKTSST